MNNGSSRASCDTDNILWKFPQPVDVSSTELHCSYFEGRACITYTFGMIEPGGVVGAAGDESHLRNVPLGSPRGEARHRRAGDGVVLAGVHLRQEHFAAPLAHLNDQRDVRRRLRS